MNISLRRSAFTISTTILLLSCIAQRNRASSSNLVYVDRQGVLRYTATRAEASFFGVNYTTPFAYAYRAHKNLGVDLEKAIRDDVYHMARLGFNAFRVHVWDTEISDTVGNLIQNDQLRLFDYLLAELKKRNIKTIVTPIAFWGTGYPERDPPTPGFSRKYGKGRATTNDTAIRAQENYLDQFFRHVNPYTNLTYVQDPDIIAVEINNEPSHSGPKDKVTDYINRLTAAVKRTGCTKPIFYNIAQNPYYADAVAASNVNGFSFQWYPSGLVANRTLKGNFLPHVDEYSIPFDDTIPAFRNKPLMVYEFDAADILEPYIYPAMARSFREAGFQWATQFAYDPLALAYANTEYQTHFINLAYTPGKAISLMIAGEVFRRMPRLKDYGTYPGDSTFGPFRVSYVNSLSEMNTDTAFYYSNNTTTRPVNIPQLRHVAGVGNSPVVKYGGSGAYFLDKIADGVWRLEVMPDAIFIRDPFERASPRKEVSRIEWRSHPIQIALPDVGEHFSIRGMNDGNAMQSTAGNSPLLVKPGTYLLSREGVVSRLFSTSRVGAWEIGEFEAPASPSVSSHDIYLRHEPIFEVSAGEALPIRATVAGVDSSAKVTVQVTRRGGLPGGTRMINMTSRGNEYVAEVPANMVSSGELNYRIIVQQSDSFTVFPGHHRGSPFAWDNYVNDTWKTYVAAERSDINLYNPTVDEDVYIYPNFRRGFQYAYITSGRSGQLALRLMMNGGSGERLMGVQHFIGDKIGTRAAALTAFNKIVLRARSVQGSSPVRFSLITTTGDAYGATVDLHDGFRDFEIPLSSLRSDSSLLLPRPYPGFLPLWFKSGATPELSIRDVEKWEVRVDGKTEPFGIEVEGIWLAR